MISEFELIDHFFSRPVRHATLGVGDDAALVAPSPGHEVVITTDTLVSGVHFLPDHDPGALGHKVLAVNLSDLAAMGARPRWVLLAITLPRAEEQWLSAFSDGFLELARHYEVDLIGGDTTRGPLAFTVTALGEIVAGKALRRDQAQVGDELWVSGQIGSAALALRHIRGDLRLKGRDLAACLARLEKPDARIELGQQLVGVATSAVDVSDGLVADAGHIAERSAVGIEIDYVQIPCVAEVAHLKGDQQVRGALLAGGDDYELLFAAPPAATAQLDAISGRLGLALTRIGRIVADVGVRVLDESGDVIDSGKGGYDHFA